jgi:hypothetical protein
VRISRWEAAALAAAAALYLAACNAVPLGHYVDDLVWVLLSRSLVHGSVMASWSVVPRVETSATWGFSILLMPVAAFFEGNALAFKVWSAFLLTTGTILFYLHTRERFSPAGRALYLGALFFNNFTIAFSGNVLSEAGYILLFGAGSLLALGRGWLHRPTPQRMALLGVLAGGLILTRAIGAAFLLAALLDLGLSRRFKDACLLAGAAALTAGPYFLVSKLTSGNYTYHSAGWALWTQGGAAVHILCSNAYFYLKGLALLTFIYFPAVISNEVWLKAILTAVVWGAALRGAARLACQEGGRFLLVYAAVYGVVCVLWPFQAPRFVFPVYPVFLIIVLEGVCALLPDRGRVPILGALGLAVLLTNLRPVEEVLKASCNQAPDMPHASYLWLRDHSRPEDVVVSMDIARVRYYAERRGVHFIPSDSEESFVRGARQIGARLFLLGDAGYVTMAPGAEDFVRGQRDRLASYLEHAEDFALVYENPEEKVRIFVLKPAIS